MSSFYVYAIRVDDVVRYIGKGMGRRCTAHLHIAERISLGETITHKRATFAHRMLAEAMNDGALIEVVVQHDGLNEETAFDLEETLIGALGRDGIDPGGVLWNRAADRRGGRTEAVKAALSDPRVRGLLKAPRSKWKMTQGQRAARSARMKGKAYPKKTAVLLERNQSEKQRDASRKNAGRAKSADHCRAMSAAAKSATATEEARQRRAANFGNFWADPEKRAAMIAMRQSPEYQARRRAIVERRKNGAVHGNSA